MRQGKADWKSAAAYKAAPHGVLFWQVLLYLRLLLNEPSEGSLIGWKSGWFGHGNGGFTKRSLDAAGQGGLEIRRSLQSCLTRGVVLAGFCSICGFCETKLQRGASLDGKAVGSDTEVVVLRNEVWMRQGKADWKSAAAYKAAPHGGLFWQGFWLYLRLLRNEPSEGSLIGWKRGWFGYGNGGLTKRSLVAAGHGGLEIRRSLQSCPTRGVVLAGFWLYLRLLRNEPSAGNPIRWKSGWFGHGSGGFTKRSLVAAGHGGLEIRRSLQGCLTWETFELVGAQAWRELNGPTG